MSIEISDFTTLVSGAAIADLVASADAVTAAMSRVEAEHPGYSYLHATEIRCNSRPCSQIMVIPVGPGFNNAAAEAFAAHRARQVDALLAERSGPSADLGN